MLVFLSFSALGQAGPPSSAESLLQALKRGDHFVLYECMKTPTPPTGHDTLRQGVIQVGKPHPLTAELGRKMAGLVERARANPPMRNRIAFEPNYLLRATSGRKTIDILIATQTRKLNVSLSSFPTINPSDPAMNDDAAWQELLKLLKSATT